MSRISELKNLALKSEQSLAEIGINSIEELRSFGALNAFIKLKKQASTKPSLNFLYAMVAGLENKHWAQIGAAEKADLLLQLEANLKLEKVLNNKD